VKDHDPAAAPINIKVYHNEMQKEVYNSAVVLDLDYWVQMPCRSGDRS
jgi:hypothetical protein